MWVESCDPGERLDVDDDRDIPVRGDAHHPLVIQVNRVDGAIARHRNVAQPPGERSARGIPKGQYGLPPPIVSQVLAVRVSKLADSATRGLGIIRSDIP